MNLNEQFRKINEQFLASAPQDVLDVFKKASEKLAQEKIEENALKVGDKMPAFALENVVGKTIDSNDLLAKGPLVIKFYRGGW